MPRGDNIDSSDQDEVRLLLEMVFVKPRKQYAEILLLQAPVERADKCMIRSPCRCRRSKTKRIGANDSMVG
jgi:hypothetical protein